MKTIDPEEKATELVEKYNPEGVAPFPFDKIQSDCSDLVISGSTKMADDVSGAIIFDKEDDKFHIIVNADKPDKRQYFTVAHELGHYFLHLEIIKTNLGHMDNSEIDSLTLYREDDGISSKEEVEANRFAAALIMPDLWVKRAWRELNNIEACANVFGVSVVAMSVRLERLGLV